MARFCQVRDDLEQHKEKTTQLLQQRVRVRSLTPFGNHGDGREVVQVLKLRFRPAGRPGGRRGSLRRRRLLLRRQQEVEGEVRGGESQLLPGLPRQRAGERRQHPHLH